MSYEDNNEMGAALKIINRLLDKVDAHENRQERERVEKMLIDNSKPLPKLVMPSDEARACAEALYRTKRYVVDGEPQDRYIVDGNDLRMAHTFLEKLAGGDA